MFMHTRSANVASNNNSALDFENVVQEVFGRQKCKKNTILYGVPEPDPAQDRNGKKNKDISFVSAFFHFVDVDLARSSDLASQQADMIVPTCLNLHQLK